MMKKYTILLLTIFFSHMFCVIGMAGWKQDNIGWRYENEDGSYYQGGWKLADGQWYFFDKEGYCLMNTLTPDGYWVDGNGHFDEQKRIYGKCMFNPTSYVKEGDKFLITGNICDTGYMDQRVLDMLYPGDIVFTPGLIHDGRVCELDTIQVIDRIAYEEKRTLVTYATDYDERNGLIEQRYYLNSQKIYSEWSYSMPCPIYRVIQKNVILIADSNTAFISEKEWHDDEPQMTLESCLETWTTFRPNNDYVWEIELNGNHINRAVDISLNYMG